MPAVVLESRAAGHAAVTRYQQFFEEVLATSPDDKELPLTESPTNNPSFDLLARHAKTALSRLRESAPNNETRHDDSENPKDKDEEKTRQFAMIETVARNLFNSLVAKPLPEPTYFAPIWRLLDILSILSDNEQCDPALLFWLIEELLDSQTISGCRRIFDFLESRRERITSKHFKQKNLVVLRMCNELLRRLSRAEDTAFCGRVYIFLFQSFPLGDRSSVNLRGEFHVENVTTYETTPDTTISQMEIDGGPGGERDSEHKTDPSRKGSFDPKDPASPMGPGELYPYFWSLQESFSQPLRLLDPAHLNNFKDCLGATIKVFTAHPVENSTLAVSRAVDELGPNLKRKRDGGRHSLGEAFNPKYLTSKDLFQLEINDLQFRRNILVQALIVLDFLSGLTPQAKEKLAKVNATNKAVIYSEQLNEDDAKWVDNMKILIATDLKSHQEGRSQEGRFFHRTVETVLSRDRNWVHWKMASCTPFQRDRLDPTVFVEAKEAAQRMAATKRLRPVPMGAVPLDFLRHEEEDEAMGKLQSLDRYQQPDLADFKRKIADDDFEIEMPTNEETKAAAIAAKASKSWRALRIASHSRLATFDKIDDPKKLGAVFEDKAVEEDDEDEKDDPVKEEDLPQDRHPIIISGPSCVGKSSLLHGLLERRGKVFSLVTRHAVREPLDGEEDGKTFHFIKAQEFNQLRDGDRLIEYGNREGVDYGTSSKTIESITEAGRIPIIELDLEAAQFAKDMDFSARYVLVKPPNEEVFMQRLKASGKSSAAIQSIIEKLPEDLDETKTSDIFDFVITNDSLEVVVANLDRYIYQKSDGHVGQHLEEDVRKDDSAMTGVDGLS